MLESYNAGMDGERDKASEKPFGYLILGLCYGLMAGHLFFLYELKPIGWPSWMFAEKLLVALVGFGGAGAFITAALESKLSSLPRQWMLFLAVAVFYLLMLIAPMQAARE